MARIFYSMAGFGRGHAARAKTIIEHLASEHEFDVFAPGDAYDFLSAAWSETPLPVRLTRIPGLQFEYTQNRLSLASSIAGGLSYLYRTVPPVVRLLRDRIATLQPDLAISDFEGTLPRAAAAEGVPLVACDHQQTLLAYHLGSLPCSLRNYAQAMSLVVRLIYYPAVNYRIASAFYAPPLKPGWKSVQQVGPMIRARIEQQSVADDGYLLSYLRPTTPPDVLATLASCNRPVRIYGLGARPTAGHLSFHPIHDEAFARDLARCSAVICAAGNQLLGEAIYLGKPVLAMPEWAHFEQRINASFLEQMKVGSWCVLESLTCRKLDRFLGELPEFRAALKGYCRRWNGTAQTIALLRKQLEKHQRNTVPAPPPAAKSPAGSAGLLQVGDPN